MSHKEDTEVEQVNFFQEKQLTREKESDDILKADIKKQLIYFLENSNIRSAWIERDEVIEFAFQLRKNNILSKKAITAKFDEMVRAANTRKSLALKNSEEFNRRIKNTVAPDFFEELWRDGKDSNLELFLEGYLRKMKKSTTMEEEKMILKIASESKNKRIITPDEADEVYAEDMKIANDWKTDNLKRYEKYAGKIELSKFSAFLG
ncbi:MAG: hypothetical protein ABIF85_06155 [Nanoarchaeota archaeon]